MSGCESWLESSLFQGGGIHSCSACFQCLFSRSMNKLGLTAVTASEELVSINGEQLCLQLILTTETRGIMHQLAILLTHHPGLERTASR